MSATHKPTICILDNNKERCLREEQVLDRAIADKRLPVHGFSNYGENYLARTGVESFPAIEVDGVYFTPKKEIEELSYEVMCSFLDMLVRRGVIPEGKSDVPA